MIEKGRTWVEAQGSTPKRRNIVLEGSGHHQPSIIFMKHAPTKSMLEGVEGSSGWVERQVMTSDLRYIDAYSDKELINILEEEGLPVPSQIESTRRSVAAVNPVKHPYWA